MRKRISPATAISLVALFFSMTGAGLAASRYLITSTSQIKPSVRASLRGRRGVRGSAGITTLTTVTTTVPICAAGAGICDIKTVVATCPPGYYVTGGGVHSTTEITSEGFPEVTSYAEAVSNTSSFDGTVTAAAICATGPGLRFVASGGGGR